MKVLFDEKNERINLFDDENYVDVMSYSVDNKKILVDSGYTLLVEDIEKFVEAINVYENFIQKKKLIDEQIGDLFDL